MSNNEDKKIRYFLRESGTIVRLTDDAIVEHLDQNGCWVRNQRLYSSMFIYYEDNFKEISFEEFELLYNSKFNKGENKVL